MLEIEYSHLSMIDDMASKGTIVKLKRNIMDMDISIEGNEVLLR